MSIAAGAKDLIQRARNVNPHAIDAVLALVFTVGALFSVAGRVGEDGVYRDDDALGIILLLLQTVPLAFRTVAPLAALSVSVTGIALHIGLGYEGVPIGTFAALLILYSAASLTDTWQSIVAALVTAIGIAVYFSADRGDPGVGQALTTGATYAVAWGLGVYARSRREYTSVVEEKAELLEREREVRAREAVANERVSIARELHDVVGHALNLIVIQSGGAKRVFDSQPAAAREALTSIETTGRQALVDIERMLGMLRETGDTEEALRPQPGLSSIGALAEGMSDAGLPVEVEIAGDPVRLPASVDLSAYRIVQEALTNALKHSGPAHVGVHIRYLPDMLELEIVDDGAGVPNHARDNGRAGRGLIGMQERVALFGGELTTGPRPEGGFRVHATLPLERGEA